MHNLKLISFNMVDSLEGLGLPEAASLRERVETNDPQDREALREVLADDLRKYGLAMVRQKIIVALEQGRVAEILKALPGGISLAEQIGIVFKPVEGGEFIYQGERATIESFELAETVFTIGMMRKLLELRGEEVRAIFTVSGYSVEEVIQKSLETIAEDVAEEEKDNCPLVCVSQIEANAFCRLITGEDLPSEMQWERAAAGRNRKKRPWGDELDHEKAVYYVDGGINGMRPVKSKPAGVSPEGIHDLIGNVWEWTKEAFLRGGSWCDNGPVLLWAESRFENRPGYRLNGFGFRVARTKK
ncbi:MAG: SUMF1/EgtB/PvdO family nonheme iron enzyme [Candidatus Saganbacteria bacterium]|nr:SUMF1/EgtB/PvdO family nonheme iron enzyme [Candidatus Saganbacteria bacterium]